MLGEVRRVWKHFPTSQNPTAAQCGCGGGTMSIFSRSIGATSKPFLYIIARRLSKVFYIKVTNRPQGCYNILAHLILAIPLSLTFVVFPRFCYISMKNIDVILANIPILANNLLTANSLLVAKSLLMANSLLTANSLHTIHSTLSYLQLDKTGKQSFSWGSSRQKLRARLELIFNPTANILGRLGMWICSVTMVAFVSLLRELRKCFELRSMSSVLYIRDLEWLLWH